LAGREASASYLRHGLQGRFSTPLIGLLDTIHGADAAASAVVDQINQMRGMGSTSGDDTLIGVVAGLYRHDLLDRN